MDYYDQENIERFLQPNVIEQLMYLNSQIYENRPRMATVEEVYQFDMDFLNDLLNRKDLQRNDAVKYTIASLHQNAVETLVQINNTSRSWDEFIMRKIGPAAHSNFMREWLNEQGQEFFSQLMPEEDQEPAKIIKFSPKE